MKPIWIYTTIIHPNRKAMGLSTNEFCVMDLIYQTQVHPTYGSDGWCSTGYGDLADFLGLSKGCVVGIGQRMSEKGMLEAKKDGKKRTSPLWYEVAYTEVKIGQKLTGRRSETDRAKGQKMTEKIRVPENTAVDTSSGRNLTDFRSDSDRKPGQNLTLHSSKEKVLKDNGGKPAEISVNIMAGNRAATLLAMVDADNRLGHEKIECMSEWLMHLRLKGKHFDADYEMEALVAQFEQCGIADLKAAVTFSKCKGYKTLVFQQNATGGKQEAGTKLFPAFWPEATRQKYAEFPHWPDDKLFKQLSGQDMTKYLQLLTANGYRETMPGQWVKAKQLQS